MPILGKAAKKLAKKLLSKKKVVGKSKMSARKAVVDEKKSKKAIQNSIYRKENRELIKKAGRNTNKASKSLSLQRKLQGVGLPKVEGRKAKRRRLKKK